MVDLFVNMSLPAGPIEEMFFLLLRLRFLIRRCMAKKISEGYMAKPENRALTAKGYIGKALAGVAAFFMLGLSRPKYL